MGAARALRAADGRRGSKRRATGALTVFAAGFLTGRGAFVLGLTLGSTIVTDGKSVWADTRMTEERIRIEAAPSRKQVENRGITHHAIVR